MAEPLTFRDLHRVLSTRIEIARAKAPDHAVIILDYSPSRSEFMLYVDALVQGSFTAFGAQLAIDRFNQLVQGTE